MEADMSTCPKDGHNMQPIGGKMVCPVCPYQYDLPTIIPSQLDLIKDNRLLRKILQDICECQGNRDELIKQAQKLIDSLSQP